MIILCATERKHEGRNNSKKLNLARMIPDMYERVGTAKQHRTAPHSIAPHGTARRCALLS